MQSVLFLEVFFAMGEFKSLPGMGTSFINILSTAGAGLKLSGLTIKRFDTLAMY